MSNSGACHFASLRWIRMGLGAAALSVCTVAASAQKQPDEVRLPVPRQATSAAPAIDGRLSLKQAVELALDNQPNIKAARANLSGTITQRESAYSALAILGGPQIHVRRKQADLGVAIAEAGLDRATLDTIHAVNRTYVTAIFASEQVKVARDAQDTLKAVHETAKKLVDAGSKEVTTNDLDRILTYVYLAGTRVNEAQVGIVRAKAALKEAIGLSSDYPLELADETLNQYVEAVQQYAQQHNAQLSCEKAVQVALRQRTDLQQSTLFAELVCLEIDAQKMSMCPYVRTFAATGDIHATILPATVINGDYRPGPLGPDMPVFLAGSRSARAERASAYHRRAEIVVEKARGLIALQVTEACERMHQEAAQVELLRKASKQASKAAKDAEKAYRADQLKTDQMLNAQVIDAQTRAQLNEALHRHAIALAALQNATGGQLWDCFEAVSADK